MRLLEKNPQFSIWEPTLGTTRHSHEANVMKPFAIIFSVADLSGNILHLGLLLC